MANIETTVELNKLLKEQNKLLQAQAKIMKSQAATMKAMMASMQKMPVEDVSKSFQAMNDAIKDADKALDEFSTDQEKMLSDVSKGADEAASSFDSMSEKLKKAGTQGIWISTAIITFQQLNQGLQAGVGAMQSMVSVAATLSKSLLSLGVSIITAPFKMLNALMQEAASFTGTEFWQAIEDTRKQFGSLATTEGKAVIDGFKNMRGEIANTGLSAFRVFGNMAERLNFVRDAATALGRTFTSFRDEFAQNVEAIAAYTKGLGLSEEAQGSMAKAALAGGKALSEQMREVASFSLQMGKTFGISSKLISRDIGEMAADFENFGSVGVKEMTQIAVFTRKLGIEVKDLMGVIGQFDDFEQAAQSAAQLSQAFGIQIDTLQMLKEQDPAARFESMRKAFLATGRSVEQLTRQELKLLSTQTGVSAEALKIGFSQSKAGMSYEEVQKQAAATEKKQLSQAEATAKLADAIERMVKQGAQMKGGFFDIFVQGFKLGIRWSRDFWGIMRNLRRSMRLTFFAGRRVGRMFTTEFPGVKNILGGIRELFEPKAWGKMMNGVVKIFKDTFKNLRTGKFSLEDTLKAFKNNFADWFDAKSPKGRKIIEGFKTFGKAILEVARQAIKLAMSGLTDSVKFITELLRPDKSIENALSKTKKLGGGVLGTFVELMQPLWETIKEQWKPLMLAFTDLFEVVWSKVKPWLQTKFDAAIQWFMDLDWKKKLLILSPVLVQALLPAFIATAGILAGKLAPLLGKAFGGMFKGAVASKDFAAQTKGVKDAFDNATGMAPSLTAFSKIPIKTLASSVLKGIAALSAVMLAMAGTFFVISKIMANVDDTQVKKTLKVMGTMGLLYLEAAGVIAGSFLVGAMITGPQGLLVLSGIAAIAAVATGMVTHALSIVQAIDSMNISAGLERKVGIFTKILDSMASVGRVLTGLMAQSGGMFSSLVVLFRGRNPLEEGLGAITKVMKTISEEIQVMLGFVNSIVSNMRPEQLTAANAVAGLMSGLASMVQALIPPPELMGSTFEKLIEIDTLGAISSYMSRTTEVLKSLIPSMINMMKEVGNIPAEALNVDAINVFSSFMGATSSLLKALTPPPELFKNLKTTVESSAAWGLIKNTVNVVGDPTKAMQPVMIFMKTMMKNLIGPEGILNDIQEFMGDFVKKTSALGSPEQVLAASKIFETTMSAFGTVAEMFSPEKLDAFNKAGGAASSNMMLSHFNENVLLPLSHDMPKIVGNFQQIGKDVRKLKSTFIDRTANTVHDMITGIENIANSLSKFEAKPIKVNLKKVSDSLGLHGSEELKVKLNNIDLTVHVDVALDADKFEEALVSRPKGSKFVIKGGKTGR